MNQRPLFEPSEFGLEDGDLVREATAVSVIVAAGGKVPGRIRLQKLVFLLDKLGLNSGFDYTYHHYGPFSSDLAEAMDYSKAFGLIIEGVEHRASDGARYSVYTINSELRLNPKAEFFNRDSVKAAIQKMNASSATVLELAATAYWLRHDENLSDWKTEIVRRKGQKTERGRLQEAVTLLEKLDLKIT